VRLDGVKSRRDGPGWHHALALTRAGLSPTVSDLREHRIAELLLSEQRRFLLELLIGLREARRDDRPLSPREVKGVEIIINGPQPAPTETSWDDHGVISFDSRELFVSGVDEVIELAASHFDEFQFIAPESFFAVARRLPMRTYRAVVAVLSPMGHIDHERWLNIDAFGDLARYFQDSHGAGWALRQLSEMYPDDSVGGSVEMWRNGQLSRFIQGLGRNSATLMDWREAGEETQARLAVWFDAVVTVYELDGQMMATQARALLAQGDEADDALDAVLMQSPVEQAPFRQIDCAQAVALVGNLISESEMVVSSAFDLVLNAQCPAVPDAVTGLPTQLRWRSRFFATIAAIANAKDTASWVERSARGDSAQRSGLAVILPELDTNFAGTRDVLARDVVATVRHYSDGLVDGAKEWTCTRCDVLRGMTELPCPACKHQPHWASQTVYG
jgi:hypothetical protein